jgi:hypothetical protein
LWILSLKLENEERGSMPKHSPRVQRSFSGIAQKVANLADGTRSGAASVVGAARRKLAVERRIGTMGEPEPSKWRKRC